MTKILLVEDEASFSEALSYVLGKEGFEVVLADTGDGAIAAFDKGGADLVLLDLMLPGLSGTEVCRQLRSRSAVPRKKSPRGYKNNADAITPTAPTHVTALGVIPIRRADAATGVINLVTAGFKERLSITAHRRLTQCRIPHRLSISVSLATLQPTLAKLPQRWGQQLELKPPVIFPAHSLLLTPTPESTRQLLINGNPSMSSSHLA